MARISPIEAGGQNVIAFLDAIAHAEGVGRFTKGQDGYDVIVGGGTFHDFSDHPRLLVKLPRYGISSTAAGRYQFLAGTWDDLKAKLRLPDFSPVSQDKAAIQLIRERRALDDVKFGRFEMAMHKCRRIWASLPGAGYRECQHQPLHRHGRAAGSCGACKRPDWRDPRHRGHRQRHTGTD